MPAHPRPVSIDIPKQWSVNEFNTKSSPTSLANWWLTFDDPLLVQLIEKALIANTTVNMAKATLVESRALRDVATATLYPTLNGSLSAQRSKSGKNDAANNFSAVLDASWEIDVFGKNRSGVLATEATVQANEASLGDIQVSISAEVAIDYILLRNTQTRLTIANLNLASQLETLQITQWRNQAGLVGYLDAEQARVSTEQLRAKIPILQTSIEQTSHAISVLTAQPPASMLTQLAILKPVPNATSNLAISFPAETLRQRPDVRVAEHRISANYALLKQADAARLPSFNLNGSLGLSALSLGSITSGSSVISSLLANAVMPLFNAGARKASVRAQEAVLDQSRISYQATVLKALQETEDSLVALRGDLERLSRLKIATEAANNAAVMANQQYKSGLVDFQIVLETQRSLLTTQDSLATANADVSADHVRLYKALGGGWSDNAQKNYQQRK